MMKGPEGLSWNYLPQKQTNFCLFTKFCSESWTYFDRVPQPKGRMRRRCCGIAPQWGHQWDILSWRYDRDVWFLIGWNWTIKHSVAVLVVLDVKYLVVSHRSWMLEGRWHCIKCSDIIWSKKCCENKFNLKSSVLHFPEFALALAVDSVALIPKYFFTTPEKWFRNLKIGCRIYKTKKDGTEQRRTAASWRQEDCS